VAAGYHSGRMKKSTVAGVAAAAGILLSCATASPPRPRISDLSARVQQYWNRRQAKDLAGMYALYSSGYRTRHTREEFLRKFRLIRFDVLDFRLVGVENVSPGVADVTVSYRTSAPKIPQPIDAQVTDRWIREKDGAWYKETEKILLPSPGSDGRPLERED
jgi:hypothetical protein